MSSILGSAAFYVVAIIVVVGLFGLAFWLTRRGPLESPAMRQRGNRLSVAESLDLDKERKLVLVRRDGVEHLLLLGQSGDLIVEGQIGRPRGARPEPKPRAERPERPERPPIREVPSEPAPPPAIPDREQRRQAIAQRLRRSGGEPADLDEAPIPFPPRRDRSPAVPVAQQPRRSPPAPLPMPEPDEEPDYGDRMRLRSSLEPDPVPGPPVGSVPETDELFDEEPDAEAFVSEPEAETEPVALADPEPGPAHAAPRRADSPFAPSRALEDEPEDEEDQGAPVPPAPARRAAKPALPSSEEPIRPPPPSRPDPDENATPRPDDMEDEIARLFGEFPSPRHD